MLASVIAYEPQVHVWSAYRYIEGFNVLKKLNEQVWLISENGDRNCRIDA